MDQETKNKIWEEFKDKFIKEGITSPDKLSFRSEIPSKQEQIKNGGFLVKLGRIGKYAVLLFRTAIRVIAVIVLLAALPDALEKHKTRYPKAFEAVDKVGKAIGDYYKNTQGSDFPKGGEQYTEAFVVFNEFWRDNEAGYLRDIKNLNEFGKISDGSFIVPGSGIEPSAIISTNESDILCDFT
jgi:hypothetical protein